MIQEIIINSETISVINSQIANFHSETEFMTFNQSLVQVSESKDGNLQTFLCGEVGKNDNLKSICFYSIVNAKRGKALQVIRGPLIPDDAPSKYREYLQFLTIAAKKNKCDFVRINPVCTDILEVSQVFKKAGFIETPFENLPLITNYVDLSKFSPDQQGYDNLLASYSPSLQDTISKISSKEGVFVEIFEGEKSIGCLLDCEKVYKEMLKKNEYGAPLYKEVLDETNEYARAGRCVVAKLSYLGKIVAFESIILGQNSKYVHCHHGASIQDDNLSFTALLHYNLMQFCINKKVEIYDLGAVSPASKLKHPWFALSNFKRGFGGVDKHFIPGQDLPLTPRYWVTNLYERYQKTLRGH